ncbi:FAD-binding oxidoreductase [Streptomyces sp. SBT349]|uniref:FAD-binding oxidoreductase n=1 Tax=Streptomyces sp. SBT349 TaxID=1580539 RepID=UPI00066AE832|nr:FAD-binding oxidoreductase [Streptomyces sp. SBT349]
MSGAVTAADARYPDVVRGLNPRYVANPEAVYLVDSAAEVAEVVQQAVDGRKRLTVRSGGHCLEDFVFNPDVQVVLDLSEMNQVYFDAERGAVAVEPGATLIEIYELMATAWGVTIPAGSFSSVGAGGHVAGGGYGFLSRAHGMAVDHLHAVEVVVVDARGMVATVVATREEDDPNRDLWWAHTGGGGGNFGVVTRYWFRSPDAVGNEPRAILPRPPGDLLISNVSFPWSELTRQGFTRLLKNFGAFHERHKAPDSPYLAVTGGLDLTHPSGGPIVLRTQVDGDHPDAERLLQDYLAEILEGVESGSPPRPRRTPWPEPVRRHATTNETQNDPTLRGDFKSALMRANLPDHQIDAFYRYLTRTDIDNPTIAVSFAGFGGRINAVGQNATAFPHRDCSMALLWTVLWDDPADDATYINWNREFYAAVYAETGGVPVPNAVTDGCYVNDADSDVADARFNKSSAPWHELYYKDNYPRLRQVKAKWDPRNFFRHGLSVQLP